MLYSSIWTSHHTFLKCHWLTKGLLFRSRVKSLNSYKLLCIWLILKGFLHADPHVKQHLSAIILSSRNVPLIFSLHTTWPLIIKSSIITLISAVLWGRMWRIKIQSPRQTHRRQKVTGHNPTKFVLRKSFCIYRFEQTSRYRQRVLIYRAAQDVKMSAKTIPYLQMD